MLTAGSPGSPFAATAAAAFVIAAVVTPLVRAFARRIGAVAAPKADRWHARPTAMLGGVAIFIAVVAATIVFVPLRPDVLIVLGASTLLFAAGLVDDFLHIRPYQKLVVQIVAASIAVQYRLILPWTPYAAINVLLTVVWLVGITNAVNMLDNMDGLSAGVAAIAATFLALNFQANHQGTEATMLAGFAGALAGFLIYNYNPASIFMGDCGSLFVGFFLAATALLSGSGGGRSRSVVSVLAVPVLVLLVPIFDTTFVTLTRKLAGRAASRGGRDHTSHRLVALGLSERRAVGLLYALAITAGTIAMGVRHASLDFALLGVVVLVVALTFVGVHLGHVRVYDEEELAAAREKPIIAFLLDLSRNRYVFEVMLDVLLIPASYYLAYAIKFGGYSAASGDWRLFALTLPAVLGIKAATFLLLGVYRGIWRYASVYDVVNLTRGVAVASIVTVLFFVFRYRFDGFSRTVFALDAVILAAAMTASRFAFRFLRGALRAAPAAARRTIIYGAGDGGELLAREIANNSTLGYHLVGFFDDDRTKRGRLLHGVRVYTGEPILDVCRRHRATDVLISTSKIDAVRLASLTADCSSAGIAVTRAQIRFEPIVVPASDAATASSHAAGASLNIT